MVFIMRQVTVKLIQEIAKESNWFKDQVFCMQQENNNGKWMGTFFTNSLWKD